VVVVEWADRVAELMPTNTIHVRLQPVGETARHIMIEHAPEK
jgi:tRNA A37 threonylcarbamoyladenosine biosynthesis protein TsaE